MQQIVTINPDGSIDGLETKTGLDLKQFGRAEVKRVSLIEWQDDDHGRGWYVLFIDGPRSGTKLSMRQWLDATKPELLDSPPFMDTVRDDLDAPVLFNTYGFAVDAEIARLNADKIGRAHV